MGPIKRSDTAGQSSVNDHDYIPPLWLQEPASSPLSPTDSFFDEFEMLVPEEQLLPTPVAFGQSGQAAPDFYSCSQGKLLEDILWSDDYETHEASRVAATLAEYEAILWNTNSAALDPEYGPGQDNSQEDTSLYAGQRPGSRPSHFLTSEQRQAILNSFKEDPKKTDACVAGEFGVSRKTVLALRERFNKTGNIDRRESSKHLLPEQRQAILHIFKSHPEKNNNTIASEFGFSPPAIGRLRKQFRETGNVDPRKLPKRLTTEERQAILNTFKKHSERTNTSIANEFGTDLSTIIRLKKQFHRIGNINPRKSSNHLTLDQRQAILHIFKNHSERSNESIADEFGVSNPSITRLRKRFRETGNLDPREPSNHLTIEQRQAIGHIFKNSSERSNESIAYEFNVSYSSIARLRKQFRETGNINPRDSLRRLTSEERQTILHIFKNSSEKSNESIANEFDFDTSAIAKLRKQFHETGNVNRGDPSKRLTLEQRQAILHIFKNDSERGNVSIASEFNVSYPSIAKLRKKFCKIGNIEPRKSSRRLTPEERQAILHIFKNDTKKGNESIAGEFNLDTSTIRRLRKQFRETGNINHRDLSKNLTAEKRQAILHIFDIDSKRSNASIAGEFGLSCSTIRRLRKRNQNT